MKFIMALCLVAIANGHPDPSDEDEIAKKTDDVKLSSEEQELKECLNITLIDGYMISPKFGTTRKATFEGVEKNTFSYINVLVNPGQSGLKDGAWVKNDVSDLIVIYQHGAMVKVHLITEGGVYSTKVMGNPLENEEAQFMLHVPITVYSVFESLSNDEATFLSYLDIPAWSPADNQEITPTKMAAIFPKFSGLFEHLAKPGYQGDWKP